VQKSSDMLANWGSFLRLQRKKPTPSPAVSPSSDVKRQTYSGPPQIRIRRIESVDSFQTTLRREMSKLGILDDDEMDYGAVLEESLNSQPLSAENSPTGLQVGPIMLSDLILGYRLPSPRLVEKDQGKNQVLSLDCLFGRDLQRLRSQILHNLRRPVHRECPSLIFRIREVGGSISTRTSQNSRPKFLPQSKKLLFNRSRTMISSSSWTMDQASTIAPGRRHSVLFTTCLNPLSPSTDNSPMALNIHQAHLLSQSDS
jgi:hypothetical protein